MKNVRHSTGKWPLHVLLAVLLGGAAGAAMAEGATPAPRNYSVADGGWLRLPPLTETVMLEHLTIGQAGALLVPPGMRELQLQRLTLKPGARLNIAASDEPFTLTVQQADIARGSVIAAPGARGEAGAAGGRGRDLTLVIKGGQIADLTVDLRGGNGGHGEPGAAGQTGKSATCWGRGARAGDAGGHGGDGAYGGDGGNLTLVLAQSRWLEVIDVMQQGGAGGDGGAAGVAGKGGTAADCWLFSLGAEADAGQVGSAGQAASAGRPGILRVQTERGR